MSIINEIAGMTIQHKRKKHTSKSNVSSPNNVSINQNETQFCVACTSARVITYAIVKYTPMTLDDLDMLLLISFYIYRQTHNAERVLIDTDYSISYGWLQLFVNELNENQVTLIPDRQGNISIHMGRVSYANDELFVQGDDPAVWQDYDNHELKRVKMDIHRLSEILQTCCRNIDLLNIKLVLRNISRPKLEDFNDISCDKSMIGLSGDAANWDKFETLARDKNITFGPNTGATSGHAVFVYELKEMYKRFNKKNKKPNTLHKQLAITNSWKNGGAIANEHLIYDLTINSIKGIVDDITYVDKENRTARGIKTRRHKKRPTKTRNAKSRRHRRK